MAKEKKEKISKKLEDLIKSIEELNALELSRLAKALEERFGVSPTPAAAPATAPAPKEEEKKEEKEIVDVVLKSFGEKKIPVIKALRKIDRDLGLKEAKDLVENLPQKVGEEVKREEAQEMKKKLEEAGAEVELK